MTGTAELAREYLDAGISVIPLRLNGTKSPDVPTWNPYRKRFATAQELDSWFAKPAGIGLVCGLISGGLEVLDFDDGTLLDPWYRSGSIEDIACRLPIVETPSFGFHVLYRCETITGNQKIALDPQAEKQTLIESRGEGGYIVGVGSPAGVHEIDLPYIQNMGPVLPEVPQITKAERVALWQAARVFDRADMLAQVQTSYEKKFNPKPKPNGPITPWDDFNRRCDWVALLTAKGWKTRNRIFWTRPGKESGTSATLRTTSDGESLCFVVFSSNANLEDKTHSAFSVYSSLYHAGDNSQAAKQLFKEGFGNAGR